MADKKKNKIRAEFRKNRSQRGPLGRLDAALPRRGDRGVQDDAVRDERISGKGELTRKRTVHGRRWPRASRPASASLLDVDEQTLPARPRAGACTA